jgi:hypothetical protein
MNGALRWTDVQRALRGDDGWIGTAIGMLDVHASSSNTDSEQYGLLEHLYNRDSMLVKLFMNQASSGKRQFPPLAWLQYYRLMFISSVSISSAMVIIFALA